MSRSQGSCDFGFVSPGKASEIAERLESRHTLLAKWNGGACVVITVKLDLDAAIVKSSIFTTYVLRDGAGRGYDSLTIQKAMATHASAVASAVGQHKSVD